MSLFIVHKRNPYFKNGAILELFEDGFQEAVVEERDHRLHVIKNVGLIIPERDVKPYCMQILRRGLDKPALRRH